MKSIPLRTMPDPRTPDDPQQTVTSRNMIEQSVRVPFDRQTGATIDEMRKGIRVLDALDRTSGDVLELEDADWEFLKQKVEKMPWAFVDRRFVTFHDDITSAGSAVNGVAHP